MYIKKKDIGNRKYCEGCPYFKLKIESIYSDDFLDDLDGIVVTCEHHNICYRINSIVHEE